MGESSSETMASVVADIEVAWRRFIAAVDAFPVDRVDQPGPGGAWSVKTIVGHVGYWDAFEVGRIAAGGEPTEIDWQSHNDVNAAETADRAFADIRTEAELSHASVMQSAVESQAATPELVRSLLYDHYVEHAEEIERRLGAG